MATIPLGPFDQARVVPQPNTRRVDMSATTQAGAAMAAAGRAISGAGETMSQVREREVSEARALARAKAQNAVFDDELALREIVLDIEARVTDGTLPYEQAQDELRARLEERETPDVPDLDEVGRVNFERGLARNRAAVASTVERVVKSARRADHKAQIIGIRDRLGKFASDPNADVDKLVAAGAELRESAMAAGLGATFDKEHQDFADRVYRDNANARLVASRDSLDGLAALERDLTQDGGRYHGKMDASAVNTILTSIQVRRAQLEAKAEAAARKGEAAAARVLTTFEQQIASTIPAPLEVMQEWTDTVMQQGTPEQQAEFRELLQSEVEVRQMLSRPPAEQRAALVELQARQRTEGATVRQQANARRLEAAVERNLKDLREQPLVAYQRQTGETIPLLDMQALVSGDVGTIRGQLAARMDTIAAMRKQYGPEVGDAPLLPQEASALSAALEQAGPRQAAEFFGRLATVMEDRSMYRAAMQQIAPDSPVRAFAGMIFAEQRSTTVRAGGLFRGAVKAEAGDVARTMLEGEALLNKSKAVKAEDGKGAFPMPPPSHFTFELESLVGSAFAGRPEAYAVAEQAVRAYYAGSAARAGDVSGELDSKRLREAVRAVLGEPVDVGGADVFPPWGMDEGDFLDRLDEGWRQVAATLPEGFPRDLDDYQLRQVSSNAYRVVGAGGAFLYGADGQPVTLVVTP